MAKPPRRGWKQEYEDIAVREGYESWDAWCLVIEARLGWTICGSKRHRKDQPCGKQPGAGVTDENKLAKQRAIDSGRCRIHGGMNMAGPDHGATKTGKWSTYGALMGSRSLPHWIAVQQQINRRDQSGEMDLLRVRMRHLVSVAEAETSDEEICVEGGLPVGLLKGMKQLLDAFKGAELGNTTDAFNLLPSMIEVFEGEIIVTECYDEIKGIITTLNKVTGTEDRKADAEGFTLTIKEATLLFDTIADLCRFFLTPEQLKQFNLSLEQLRGGNVPDILVSHQLEAG